MKNIIISSWVGCVLTVFFLLVFKACLALAGLLDTGSSYSGALMSGGEGSEIWEQNGDGDWMPSEAGNSDAYWELNSQGDIIPKGVGYGFNADGDLQPL